jgi:hypothetical protein
MVIVLSVPHNCVDAPFLFLPHCLAVALHDRYRGEFGEALSHEGDGFVMGHKTAVSPEPGKGVLENPTPPDDFRSVSPALDDLQSNPLSGTS